MSKKKRRGLLLSLTLIALLLVIIGVFLDSVLEDNPIRLVAFWGICLLVICLVFIVAIIDIRAVRKEFLVKQAELDNQFADTLTEAYENKEQPQ